jgi:HSP20 family molecular chaperone IbpA
MDEQTNREDDRTIYMWERRFGSFQRTLPFPGGIDDKKVAADFKDGVLTKRINGGDRTSPGHRAACCARRRTSAT